MVSQRLYHTIPSGLPRSQWISINITSSLLCRLLNMIPVRFDIRSCLLIPIVEKRSRSLVITNSCSKHLMSATNISSCMCATTWQPSLMYWIQLCVRAKSMWHPMVRNICTMLHSSTRCSIMQIHSSSIKLMCISV